MKNMVKLNYISIHISRKIEKQGYWNYNSEGGAVFFFLEISEDCLNQRVVKKPINSALRKCISSWKQAVDWPTQRMFKTVFTRHICV